MTQRKRPKPRRKLHSVRTSARQLPRRPPAALPDMPVESGDQLPEGGAHPVLPSAWRDPFIYLIGLLPVLILALDSTYIYTPAGSLDPWIYYGYMRHLKDMKILFPGTYYGSRLSWILPGALVRSLLPSVAANYVLHLTVFFVAVFSLYWILKKAFNARVAILSCICLASYPYFWGAIGWDYVDGAGIAYYLLTMAFLLNAARSPRRYGFLIAAGAAYAGVLYSNLAWAVFSPAFFGFYLFLVAGNGIRHIWKEIFRFILWFGLGWAAVSAALGAANYLLEGNFWFYQPSFSFALSWRGVKNPWKAPNYGWLRSGYWLILPFLGCVAALLACVRTRWKCALGDVRLFFALNMLYSAGVLTYMDVSGNPLLQFRYYASYMIAPAVLALGPILFASVSTIRKFSFVIVFGAALASLFFTWGVSPHGAIAAFAGSHLGKLFVIGIGIAAAGIMLSRFPSAVFLGLAGLAVVYTCCRLGGAIAGEGAQAYKRIVAGMEAVEQVRQGQPVKFWFSHNDENLAEFNSLSSCYLWGPSAINFDFPSLGKNVTFENGTVIVVPSSKPEVASEVKDAFSGRNSIPTSTGRQRIESGGHGYWLHFFRVEPNSELYAPLQVSFNPDGSFGNMGLAPEGSAGMPFPMSRWSLSHNSDGIGVKHDVADGILIDTAKGRWDWSCIYPKLVAPRLGTYRFVLTYQLLEGDITFGALKADKSIWLQQAGHSYRAGQDLVKEFTVVLEQGQAFWLLTANNRTEDAPTRYLMKRLTAYVYKPSTAPLRAESSRPNAGPAK